MSRMMKSKRAQPINNKRRRHVLTEKKLTGIRVYRKQYMKQRSRTSHLPLRSSWQAGCLRSLARPVDVNISDSRRRRRGSETHKGKYSVERKIYPNIRICIEYRFRNDSNKNCSDTKQDGRSRFLKIFILF
jgi:hypothetical protein